MKILLSPDPIAQPVAAANEHGLLAVRAASGRGVLRADADASGPAGKLPGGG